VPLSTSNSNQKIEAGCRGRTWRTALILFLVLLGSWEVFWRLNGFHPVLADDWDIWAVNRRAASRAGRRAVALVGASRIQLGLHPDVFEKITGLRPIVLAIDGNSPLPVLEHLAQDTGFTGSVICSLIPMFLAEPLKTGRAEKWIRKFQEQKWSSRIDTRLSLRVQQLFVFRYSGLMPAALWSDFKEAQWPRMPYAPMRADRFRPADFSKADVAGIVAGRIRREREIHAAADPLPPDRLLERVEHIRRLAKRIEERGGKVAFVRFPSGGMVRKLEQETWPRQSYWDVFANRVEAAAVHFEDHPSLRRFDTPDGTHLDVKDAKEFTRELIHVLAQAGFMPWE